MSEDAQTESIMVDGKPRLQYVPKYSYPQQDSAVMDSPQSASSFASPISSNFAQDRSHLSTPTPAGRSRVSEQLSTMGHSRYESTGSPLKSEFSANVSNGEMPPPGRSNLTSGSYKSGRRQRPRSLYADLDSYINNSSPSLIVKKSHDSLRSNNDSITGSPQCAQPKQIPSLNTLASSNEPILQFSPPSNSYSTKPGNRSSLYSMGSNNSQKALHVLSPPSLGTGISRSGSRSELDNTSSYNANGSEIFYNSRSSSPVRNGSPSKRKDSSSSTTNPFNYSSISMTNQNILQKPAHRRGHRYKHSSVSMNLFQEPKKRANLNIPTSLPIPSVTEFFESSTYSQKLKLFLCCFHLAYSSVIFLAGFQYSLACLTTLSHLVFFDSINNLLVVVVEIFKNFEVWDKSSIRFPFGLTRLEVLFGFALSVSLFYVGFDLITHCLEEFVVSLIDQDFNHDNHHNHNNDEHKKLSDGIFLFLVLTGIFITLLANKILSFNDNPFTENGEAIGDGKLHYKRSNLDLLATADNPKKKGSSNIGILEFLRKNSYDKLIDGIKYVTDNNTVVKDPIKFLTLIFLGYLLFYPSISKFSSDFKFNELQTFVMATLILYFAFNMMKKLSLVILLSFPYGNRIFKKNSNEINDELIKLDSFKSTFKVKKIIISKVNYHLFVVLIKIKMVGGSDKDEFRLHADVSRVVKRVLIRNGLENDSINFDITLDVDRM
ncbi:Zn(2+) transporter [Saccharomycopsis crataegensis]|uniref:Zn(2+) transporter n=1 Tax=Saccharomycopsis crataegensis TaxID=43959 RepID=A0AAV5QMY8_9ASCO|nr:Zn(2+) transporter [Saccharomycopsis crataegensis]